MCGGESLPCGIFPVVIVCLRAPKRVWEISRKIYVCRRVDRVSPLPCRSPNPVLPFLPGLFLPRSASHHPPVQGLRRDRALVRATLHCFTTLFSFFSPSGIHFLVHFVWGARVGSHLCLGVEQGAVATRVALRVSLVDSLLAGCAEI